MLQVEAYTHSIPYPGLRSPSDGSPKLVTLGHITFVHRCTKGTCNDLHLIPIQRCTCQNTYNWKWIRKSQKSCSSEEGSCGHSSLSGMAFYI
ncbi:hypothetical protein CK203_081860 [Vitis vinifera]|uniref:Uncharacterized protein n=1 Tax=Vitis vinifera TaxID=29760 RepID=A0A438EAE6_VITVI|nr:hypothetical protein CK203_081860 [Vitis vinifera]